MSEVAEANPIQDLIQNTIDQNYTNANGNFADIMTLKLNDVLDQEKIRLADQIYNGIEPEELEPNEVDPEDQLTVDDSQELEAEAEAETEAEEEIAVEEPEEPEEAA